MPCTSTIIIFSLISVPKDLDSLLDGLDGVRPVDTPVILSTEPVLVLEHPDVVVNIPNDPQEEGAREMHKRRVKQEEMSIKREQEEGDEEPKEEEEGEGEEDESMEKDEEDGEDHGRMTLISVDSAPIIAVDWSPFVGSKHIAAISLTGVLVRMHIEWL